jgi:hypothetical protein
MVLGGAARFEALDLERIDGLDLFRWEARGSWGVIRGRGFLAFWLVAVPRWESRAPRGRVAWAGYCWFASSGPRGPLWLDPLWGRPLDN